jgi:tetratricopeptide (TPR) repeat protein
MSMGMTVSVFSDNLKELPQMTKVEQAQLNNAEKLFDTGEYAAAQLKYEQILTSNPQNFVAMYQLANILYITKSYDKSLEMINKASTFKSHLLAPLKALESENYQQLSQVKRAISTLEKAIDTMPDNAYLHYSLGLRYGVNDNPEQAVELFKQTLKLDPDFKEAHLQLGAAYYEYDYKIPAFLAFTQFLRLEPTTERSKYILSLVKELLTSGVLIEKKDGKTNIIIEVAQQPKGDEGDFEFLDALMSTIRVNMLTENNPINTETHIQLQQYANIFSALEKSDKQDTFVWTFYAPYFTALHKKGLSEVFYYYANQSQQIPEISNWHKKNKKQVKLLLDFSTEFQWIKY